MRGLVLAALSAAGWLHGQTAESIVTKRCLPCHNNQLDNAGISFENRDTVVAKAGRIIPAISHKGDIKMPPGPKLPDGEIAILTAWVQKGVPGLRASSSTAHTYPFEVWNFDRLNSIAGYPTKVEGHPRVIDSPVGKAVEFDGVEDALFIEDHPLADAANFTWEVLFRPDRGGKAEQRFFHLQERDAKTGADTQNRFLFEIRVTGDEWFLDSFVMSPTGSKALLNTAHRHPLGAWYRVAQVYDGHSYRNYIDGVLENEGEVSFTPNLAGHASAGVRINRRDYFKGAIARARFTKGALSPKEFFK